MCINFTTKQKNTVSWLDEWFYILTQAYTYEYHNLTHYVSNVRTHFRTQREHLQTFYLIPTRWKRISLKESCRKERINWARLFAELYTPIQFGVN